MKRYRLLFPLLICLLLTACGGKKEAEGPSGIVYVPQAVPFSSSLDQPESACVSGDGLCLLGAVFKDGPSGDRDLSLVRVPLEGGKAEALPNFCPVRLETDKEYESTGGYLRPGADGTIWLIENVYVVGSGVSPVLRQLDSEGNELFLFDGSGLKQHLGAEWIYDLWTVGAGTLFVNTGEAVVLLDEAGTVQATLEGLQLHYKRFVTLSDGRVGIPSAVQSPEGTVSQLRIIDTAAGDWAQEAFALPFNASCIQTGEGERLFYYTDGDALYAWRQGAEEPERVMSWVESGVDANSLTAFSFLEDGRLAAVTNSGNSYAQKAHLDLLSPTDAASLPERTVLNLSSLYPLSDMRDDIARFNRESDSCYISVKEYISDYLNSSPAILDQAMLRLNVDMTTGNGPDILVLHPYLPVRRMEAAGLLEDLWPYIDADPELSRDALMARPLEAMEYKGGLYRVADSFSLKTIVGLKSVVGDRMSWTYDDFWDALNTIPDGSAAAGYGSKNFVLQQLIEHDAESFIDWENGTSRFDSEEFRALLELCNRFPDEMDNDYILEVALYNREQVLMDTSIWSPDRFQYYIELSGGDASFVGFPNETGRAGTCFWLEGALAITAASERKEEAWSFLRMFLLPGIEEGATLKENDQLESFPINRADFERTMEQARTPVMGTRNGVLQEVHRYNTGFTYFDLDVTIPIDALTQEEYDLLMALYNAAEGTTDYDRNLINIITEQAGVYFAGDRSLDDTVAAIQSRVGLYLNELQ